MSHPSGVRVWRAAVALLLLLVLGLLAVHNLDYPGVWYDESVQVWLAQGLFALGPPGEPAQGWRDVVRMNRRTNLDPGGYSLWLHVWSKAGLGLVWLRLSAYVFFLLTLALLARWAWELTASASAAVFAPFIALAYGLVLSFAFEIRAYSMEVAGVVAAGYALHRAVRTGSLRDHLWLGLVCSVFLSSRYSFVVVVVAALGALACVRMRTLGRPLEELERLACLLVPLLNSGALIYRVSLRYHLAQMAASRAAAGLRAPDYVSPWVLGGQFSGALVALLRENLLSPAALPITLAVAALALWPLARRQRPLAGWPGSGSFPAVATMALLAQLVSAALSIRGLYPWDLGQKWSLYLHGVSIVCALYLASACWWAARRSRAAPALAAAATVIVLALAVRGAGFQRVHWGDLSPALGRLNASPVRAGSVFVTVHEVPTVRYFYELGPMRGIDRYPAAFRFERLGERGTIDAGRECLEYVISATSPDVLAARFPGVTLRRVEGKAAASLLRVEGPRPPHCATAAALTTREASGPDLGAPGSAGSAGGRATAGGPGTGSSTDETPPGGSAPGSRRPPT